MIGADSMMSFLVGCFYLKEVLLMIFFSVACCKSLKSSLHLKAKSIFLNLICFLFFFLNAGREQSVQIVIKLIHQ